MHKSKNATAPSHVKHESDSLVIDNNNNDSDDDESDANDQQSPSLADDDVFDTNLSPIPGEIMSTTLVETPTSGCAPNGSTVDIMNMDIIFDNAPIEVDTSIGNTSNTTIDGEIIERAILTPTYFDKVHINGEMYEIVTLDEPASSTCNISSDSIDASMHEDANGSIDSVGSANINFVVDNVHLTNVMELSSTSAVVSAIPEPVQVDTNGDSNAASNEMPHEVNGSEVVAETEPIEAAAARAEPTEAAIASVGEEDKDIFAELASTAKSAEAEKERAARELEERRRKRKPLPVLAIKYKRRRKFSTNDGSPPESKEPIDLSMDKAKGDTEPAEIESTQLSAEAGPADQMEPVGLVDSDDRTQAADVDAEPMASGEETETDAVEREEKSVVPDESNEREQTNDSDEQSNFMNSLVVVESQDPDDPTRTIYAVHIVDPETKLMSEQPLDLPDDVIQRIRQSM